MEQEIELREIFFIIRKRAWMVVAITGLALVLSAVISFYVQTPVYRTSTTLIVIKEDQPVVDQGTLMLNRQLVKTYAQIIQSRTVAEEVIPSLNLDMTPTALQNRISVNAVGDTEILRIDIEDPNPVRARILANRVADVFIVQIGGIMKIDNVSVIDRAVVPDEPFKPRPLMNMAIATVLGLMIGLGLIFLLEYLDNTIKTPDDVQNHLGLPILSGIPHFDLEKEERQTQRRSSKAVGRATGEVTRDG